MMLSRTWKRLVGATSAVLLVSTGSLLATSTAAAVDTVANEIAFYDFTTAPADGVTVPNLAGNDVGPARVVNGNTGLWTDNALTLTGGSKTSTGSWVELPADLLAGNPVATVQIEVKPDASMLSAFHFMWNIGSDSNTEYFFASVNCGNQRNPLTGIKIDGAEQLIQATSCLVNPDEWTSITSTIDGDAGTSSLFINGTEVATGKVAGGPNAIADHSLNTIGRSPWPDPLFKGAVANFRVYDSVLSADEIAAISAEDALLHETALQESAATKLAELTIPTEVSVEYLGLPTLGGTVSWETSDPAVIALDGKVTQPSAEAGPVDVVLTATTSVRGITATQEFPVSVLPSTLTAEERIQKVLDTYAIAPVLRSGTQLPVPEQGTVEFLAGDGLTVTEGVVTGAGQSTIEAKITVDGVTTSKVFTVNVLPETDSQLVLSYHRAPTSDLTANNGDVAYSMHLALGDGATWDPLNENYGIFFARTSIKPTNAVDVRAQTHRSLKDPALFYMKDGSFGVVSVRTLRGTDQRDPDAKNAILFATSTDLLSFDEAANSRSLIHVGETNGVNNPNVVYDSANDQYIVSWTDDGGIPKWTIFPDLVDRSSAHGPVNVGQVPMIGLVPTAEIDNYTRGHQVPIANDLISPMITRYGRIVNTGIEGPSTQNVAVDSTAADVTCPNSVTLSYSDGSNRTMPVEGWDYSGVDFSTPGTYQVTSPIKQLDYPLPFAEDRADPTVRPWVWEHDGVTETKYLMIATNDIHGDNVWQNGKPHMPIRMADTIMELADTPGDPNGLIGSDGFNPLESTLRQAGDLNTDGQAITGSFWAPELHEIDGVLSILFMPSYNSNWTDGAAAIMQLKRDADGDFMDPTLPESWTDPKTVTRADGSPISQRTDGSVGMSLDMTYFTDELGNAYYSWQQLGATYIASVDPADPYTLTSDPVLIVSPEYAWDNVIAEGPNVVNRDGKLYMIYSGSSVGRTYTTGLAIADASGTTDLLNPDAWQKLNYPIQKSGIFNDEWQLGTGHGMWSTDEDGQTMYVFHAYANPTDGYSNYGGRDTFIRRVHWAADGLPIFDMSLEEEVLPGTVATCNVVVEPVVEPTDEPTVEPTTEPTVEPTDEPTAVVGPADKTPTDKVPTTKAPTKLSFTGASVAGLISLAGLLVLAGLAMRKRSELN